MAFRPSTQHEPNQSLTSDGSSTSLTPPTDAAASRRNPLNFHVSARMNPQNRATSWDLLIGGFQAMSDIKREEAASRPQQPLCSPPPPPPGRPNPLNYRTVWLCPNGKKAHISLDRVQHFKPYKIAVMPGSFDALNWCQRCSNPSMLEANNRIYTGCDGKRYRQVIDNPWGELE